MLLVTSVTMVYCWLAFNLSTRITNSFSMELFLRNSACTCAWGYCSALAELCISLFIFLSVQFYPLLVFASSNIFFISELAEGSLCSIVQVFNEKVKQHWPPYGPLGYTTSEVPPTVLCAIDQHTLGLAVQPHSIHLTVNLPNPWNVTLPARLV